MATNIHPTALVEPGAELGANCEIMAYAVVTRHCELGAGVTVHPFAVVGGDPQYLSFDRRLRSGVQIGAGAVIREHVTVNRSIREGEATRIGAEAFLMAASHVAHDCAVGDKVVLANGVLLAGHVTVGNHAFVGGGAAVHQFCRLGESAMISGRAALTRDVPPYVMAAERDEVIGLNAVGLRRRAFTRAVMAELKQAFRAVYFTPGNIREVAAAALAGGGFATAEARQFLEFFTGGQRGFVRARRDKAGAEAQAS